MKIALVIFQIIVSLFLIVLVLVQSGGSGFGNNSVRKSSFSRRGLDKLIFKSTFVFCFLFIILSFIPLFIN